MRKLIGKVLTRSDTSANWSKNNPVLGKGECGYATDLRRTKHGDGTTKWNSLKWDDAATANGHLVNSDVPAGAKFTDTTYAAATISANGLMSASDKSKLDGIGAGSNVKSVNGKTGAVTINKADVGLSNVDNTKDADKHVLANNIQWGGNNIAGDISPLDVATSNLFAGNVMAYSKPAGITVEYSTDGGTTWVDYGASDESKIRLVTPEVGGVSYYLGKKTTAQTATKDLLRITLDARKMGIYCSPKSMLIEISQNGGSDSYVNIEYSTRASDTVFHNFGRYVISGWSGWNSIPIYNIPSHAFGTNGRDDQPVNIRLTFGFTSYYSGWESKTTFFVSRMSMIATNRWGAPSSMASVNSVYRLDENQNTTFPAKVTAKSFAGATATSSADGLMSKSDKAKLDGIGTGSNVKSVNGKTGAVTLAKGDIGLGSVANLDQSKAIKSITRSGTTFTATALDGTKTTFTQQDNNTTYGIATSSADGLMSKTDKAKLDGISSGADASPIKTVKVNGTALTPDSNKAVNVTVPTLANNATTTTSGMALDARMGKTLSDQISSVKTGAIDQIVNLTVEGWTGDAAPYSQAVNVTGMSSELLCELFSACSKSATVAERKAYNKAYAIVASGYAETADGKVTFSVDKKPAIDIGVRIKSISKANAVSDQTSTDISNAVDAMGNTLEGRVNALSADLAKQWEKIYPVGSIYISVSSTNPASLFGGTWEQLKDVFLLAAGDTYSAGSTGGEAQHTLTVDEMPSHTHQGYTDPNYCAVYTGDNNVWKQIIQYKDNTGYTDGYHFEFTGGSQPHNNMPPYITVYMWKRTA